MHEQTIAHLVMLMNAASAWALCGLI